MHFTRISKMALLFENHFRIGVPGKFQILANTPLVYENLPGKNGNPAIGSSRCRPAAALPNSGGSGGGLGRGSWGKGVGAHHDSNWDRGRGGVASSGGGPRLPAAAAAGALAPARLRPRQRFGRFG
jgi:hypothetical protein